MENHCSVHSSSNWWLNPRRVGVLARHTFTQLVRMKVFYFLVIFGALVIAANFLELPQFYGPEAVETGELQILKGTCIGVMKIFAIIFVISATALLIPKDVEDRTLYTILAKPVPRIDYLAGKLLGVLLVTGLALLLMDGLMTGVLWYRTHHLVTFTEMVQTKRGASPEMIAEMKQTYLKQGATWSLQGGVLVVFLQACVLAAAALLLSTFSTSTLFTIVVGFLLFLIGHFQADAVEYYKKTAELGTGTWGVWLTRFISLVFPNFQLFDVTDSIIAGTTVTASVILNLTALTAVYVIIYTLLSWYIFSDREF